MLPRQVSRLVIESGLSAVAEPARLLVPLAAAAHTLRIVSLAAQILADGQHWRGVLNASHLGGLHFLHSTLKWARIWVFWTVAQCRRSVLNASHLGGPHLQDLWSQGFRVSGPHSNHRSMYL